MNAIQKWALEWGVPPEALRDLRGRLGVASDPRAQSAPGTEGQASDQVRLEASRKGLRLFRNNVGAMQDESGRVVRFGLANDTRALNKVLKSGDLIGFRPVVIAPEHVGHTLGQFVSREIKRPDWVYTGNAREVAQLAWAELLQSYGCDAGFATGEGSL